MLVVALRGNGFLGDDLEHFLDLVGRLVVARVQTQGNVELLNVIMCKHPDTRVAQHKVGVQGHEELTQGGRPRRRPEGSNSQIQQGW